MERLLVLHWLTSTAQHCLSSALQEAAKREEEAQRLRAEVGERGQLFALIEPAKPESHRMCIGHWALRGCMATQHATAAAPLTLNTQPSTCWPRI